MGVMPEDRARRWNKVIRKYAIPTSPTIADKIDADNVAPVSALDRLKVAEQDRLLETAKSKTRTR